MSEQKQNEQLNQDEKLKERDQKSLQSDDKEIIEKRRPPEGSEPISDAGKKREEGRRYQ